jgi:iron complex outermembrane receptor protein
MLRAMDTRRSLRSFGIAVLVSMAMPSRGIAQTAPPRPGLGELSIEELMSVRVTSAARREQPTFDVAAAVFVITHEDIERSGLSSIPDLLRLVPGVQVASINSNRWAISVRGFSDLYSNKLLVLIDGRSVYNRLFSGVIWDAQDPMLDDVERIEVIRGPGAALWGANAVNGVINIVTKTATETHGLVARTDAGTDGEQASVRYGGTGRAGDYRFFAQMTDRGTSLESPGVEARDPSQQYTAGFRLDKSAGPDSVMIEGGLAAGRLHSLWFDLNPHAAAPITDEPSTTGAGHILARWTHARPGGPTFQLQSYGDLESRREPVGDYMRQVIDIDSQYRMPIGKYQGVIAGAGYRHAVESLGPTIGLAIVPEESAVSLTSVFVQDEISAAQDRLTTTLGAHWQYDSSSGSGFEPSARVMWKLRPSQRLWASASRALHTPSLTDRGLRLIFPPVATPAGLPLVVTAVGNPDLKTETFLDAEVGYRVEAGAVASFDVTAFAGRYDHLLTTEASPAVLEFTPQPQLKVATTFGNYLRATTRGAELALHWMPAPAWRFDANYSAFHMTPHLDPASTDPNAARDDGNTATSQWSLAVTYSPSSRAALHLALGHLGRLEQLQVPAYTRADVTVDWRLTPRLAVMVIGQNLLTASHAEFAGVDDLLQFTQVSRSATVRFRWGPK